MAEFTEVSGRSNSAQNPLVPKLVMCWTSPQHLPTTYRGKGTTRTIFAVFAASRIGTASLSSRSKTAVGAAWREPTTWNFPSIKHFSGIFGNPMSSVPRKVEFGEFLIVFLSVCMYKYGKVTWHVIGDILYSYQCM